MMRRMALAVLLPGLATLCVLGSAGMQADGNAPSPEELRALLDRVIANQHRDDAALNEYERVEHRQERKSERAAALSEDESVRVVPTGTGTIRVQIAEKGRPADPDRYHRQLRDVEAALVAALDPTSPKQRPAEEKFIKRVRERRELVDAVREAFRVSWLGRETRHGRTLAKLALEPNPAYKPTSRTTGFLRHVRATLWVEETSGQFARLEAETISDISFGGGVLGKIYRGGRVVIEQAEVAPGIWLPTRYEYNFSGRKFLFSSEVHEVTQVTQYRRIGPPKDALAVIRRELSTGAL